MLPSRRDDDALRRVNARDRTRSNECGNGSAFLAKGYNRRRRLPLRQFIRFPVLSVYAVTRSALRSIPLRPSKSPRHARTGKPIVR